MFLPTNFSNFEGNKLSTSKNGDLVNILDFPEQQDSLRYALTANPQN